MYTGIAYFLFDQFHFCGKILGCILEKTILAMDAVLHVIEHAPFSSINKIWLTPASEFILCLLILAVTNFLFCRTKRSIRITLVIFFLFSIFVSFKRYNNLRTSEIVLFAIAKHRTIAFKSGDQAVIMSDLADTSKSFKRSVQPYLDSCQVSKLTLIKPGSDYSNPLFIKKGNLIIFATKTLFIFNKTISMTDLPHKIQVDYVFLPDRRVKNIIKISKNFNYQKLIVYTDDTTPDKIKKPYPIAPGERKYLVITGNKSLILASN